MQVFAQHAGPSRPHTAQNTQWNTGSPIQPIGHQTQALHGIESRFATSQTQGQPTMPSISYPGTPLVPNAPYHPAHSAFTVDNWQGPTRESYNQPHSIHSFAFPDTTPHGQGNYHGYWVQPSTMDSTHLPYVDIAKPE